MIIPLKGDPPWAFKNGLFMSSICHRDLRSLQEGKMFFSIQSTPHNKPYGKIVCPWNADLVKNIDLMFAPGILM